MDLVKSLKDYKPFDSTETHSVKSILDFISSTDNAYSRSNLDGHITGSAFLLSSDLNRILLTHQKASGRWLQFGGHSDGDANTLRVAVRETIEESGIKNFMLLTKEIFDVDVHSVPFRASKNEPEHFHYDIRFVFTTEQESFIISDESNDLKWFTFEEYRATMHREENIRFIKKWEKLRVTLENKH